MTDKQRVLKVAPKAVCKANWTKSGRYTVHFNQQVTDFNGKQITELHTGTSNPADAWTFAAEELRLK